ncbi:MAG: riboflavin synthase [Owenweeksia sp.]|nr:riboflavin synthase [Owenweeksia sp.]
MFTGIIEELGIVEQLRQEGRNLHIDIHSHFTEELKIDQSIAHNGACLTVVAIADEVYTVTAIDETLKRTNLSALQVGSQLNLERCLVAGARLDGHMVQGHIDTTGRCQKIEEEDGSWKFHFSHSTTVGHLTVEKGSICINGVSLTVVDSMPGSFSVAIIPYTYEHTNFKYLKVGDQVNLEFDILGKYISRLMESRQA